MAVSQCNSENHAHFHTLEGSVVIQPAVGAGQKRLAILDRMAVSVLFHCKAAPRTSIDASKGFWAILHSVFPSHRIETLPLGPL